MPARNKILGALTLLKGLTLCSPASLEPYRRPSAEALLGHPLFGSVRDPYEEPTATRFDSRFEREARSMDEITALIRRECEESQAILPVPTGPPIGSFAPAPPRLNVHGPGSGPPPPQFLTPLGTGSLSSAQDMAAALAKMAPMRPLDDE